MAAIYVDRHTDLKELLAMAGKSEDATLLIPDLQRPYVWQPNQVIVLRGPLEGCCSLLRTRASAKAFTRVRIEGRFNFLFEQRKQF